MKLLKKIFASLVTLCVCVSFSACSDQSWSVKSGDISLSMGTYICFLSSAFSEASKNLNGDQYSTSNKSILNETIDEKKASDWIKDKAIQECKDLISVEKKFEELGLSLSEDNINMAEESTNKVWGQYGKAYEKFGISRESYNRAVNLLAYKKQSLFDGLYGKDGVEAVSDEELEQYYRENNANVSIITKDLTKKSKASSKSQNDDENQSEEKTEEPTESGDDANSDEEISMPEDGSMSEEEIEELRKKFEEYAKDINSGSKTIQEAGENFKADEELESDPVKTSTIGLKQTEYSTYPNEVLESIKTLEVSKAKVVRAGDMYYLIVKNDIEPDVEKLKTEEYRRQSTLYEMKHEVFEKSITEWSESNDYQINRYGMSKHQPSIFEKQS